MDKNVNILEDIFENFICAITTHSRHDQTILLCNSVCDVSICQDSTVGYISVLIVWSVKYKMYSPLKNGK